jgi:hypothetical protein
MAQQETEQLSRILISAALGRAVSTIAELGVADLVQTCQPQPVERLARASKTHEPSLYRILRFLASHGLFRETENRHFDHTPLSAALRTDAPGSYRAGAQLFHHLFAAWDGLHHSSEWLGATISKGQGYEPSSAQRAVCRRNPARLVLMRDARQTFAL